MSGPQIPIEFARPEWLWALLAIPLVYPVYRFSLVDLPRRQLLASMVVRCVMLTLLVFCLAGTSYLQFDNEVYAVFAIDESLSIGKDGRKTAREFLSTATEGRDESRYRVIRFASTPGHSDASAGGDPDGAKERAEWAKGTDVQSTLEVALAGVPSGFVPHVVLLTDGNETEGNASALASSAGIRISTVPLATGMDPEIQLTAVNTPTQVAEGEPFEIEVIVDSNHQDTAIVEVFAGDFRVASQLESLKAGENRFRFTRQIDQPTEFSAVVRRPGPEQAAAGDFEDTLLDNNMASGLVFTSGQPRVLLIDSAPETSRSLELALKEEGIKLEVRPPAGLPATLSELQNYEVLVLSNVAATEMSSGQMDVIRSYVGELGGGLIMLGGDDSFGLGGYYNTVVEEVLPVRCDFQKEKEKPGLGMILIIDKSSSMGGLKIELAKDAARAAVALLGNKDQIGVIAFDGQPYWISEVGPATQKATVNDQIAGIEAGGGTTLYPAMDEACQALLNTQARLKHIIILSDGYSSPGRFDDIVQDMAAAQITVSTVGIGDADQATLEKIALAGGGRYYFSSDASAVPQIFARETITASKSAINEEPFLPLIVRSTTVLSGIDIEQAPFLLGYVVTRPKATSEVILTTESGDPLLSWWRYGLGMSVAFTSDAQNRWAAEWLTWDGYNKFWAQVIRHCMRRKADSRFEFEVSSRGDERLITIDVVGPRGRFVNQAETELTLVAPDLGKTTIPVRQVAPGRYEASVEMVELGAWQLQVSQTVDGEEIGRQARGIVVGYHQELRLASCNEDFLRTLADSSGGRFSPNPKSVFDPVDGQRASTPGALWPWLAAIVAILFVLDVALRRLDMSRVFGTQIHRPEIRRA